VNTALEFVAYAKQKGDLTYSSAGNGSTSHLAGELLKKVTGIPLQHIPYKSAGNALTAMLTGEVQVSFLSPLTAHAQLKAGKVKALAVSSTTRFAGAPEIPSAAEAGIPGMDAKLWFGLFAPAKTPKSIVASQPQIGDILRPRHRRPSSSRACRRAERPELAIGWPSSRADAGHSGGG
jgi:tripartite-type tricarboxylate transporter receptor subunit TctC